MSRGGGDGVTRDEAGKPVTEVRGVVWFHFYMIPLSVFQRDFRTISSRVCGVKKQTFLEGGQAICSRVGGCFSHKFASSVCLWEQKLIIWARSQAFIYFEWNSGHLQL